MRRFGLRVCATVLALLAVSAVVRGQGAPGLHFGVTGGAEFPIQNQSDVFKTGWNGGILVAINFGDSPFGVRIDGTYHTMDTKSLVLFPTGSNDVRIVSGTGDLVIGGRHGAVQPYLLGGVGAYDMRFRGEDLAHNTFSETTTRFGWNAGAGLAFPLGASNSRIFVEARYTSISTNGDRFSNSVTTGGTRFTFVPVNLGFVF